MFESIKLYGDLLFKNEKSVLFREFKNNICIIIIFRQIIEILQTSQACEITSDIVQSVQTERKNLEKLKVYF